MKLIPPASGPHPTSGLTGRPKPNPFGGMIPHSASRRRPAKSPRRQRQDDFLAAYANAGVIAYAAQVTGIDRTTHHVWLREDPTYRSRFEAAQYDAADKLKFDACCRALQGDEVPVFHQGKQVGVRREYSDKLLMSLLRTARPEKFGDDAAIAANEAKAPVPSSGLSPDQSQQLVRLHDKRYKPGATNMTEPEMS